MRHVLRPAEFDRPAKHMPTNHGSFANSCRETETLGGLPRNWKL